MVLIWYRVIFTLHRIKKFDRISANVILNWTITPKYIYLKIAWVLSYCAYRKRYWYREMDMTASHANDFRITGSSWGESTGDRLIPINERTCSNGQLWCFVLWTWTITLRWRHNDHNCVSNHQPRGCLLNRLFRRRSKKTSKLRVTGLCVGNSPGPVNSPHKGPVTRKMFPFDDVIMQWSWINSGADGNLRRHDAHMALASSFQWISIIMNTTTIVITTIVASNVSGNEITGSVACGLNHPR